MSSSTPSTIRLEVSGENLELLKLLLNNIQLNSSVRNVALEIESNSKLAKSDLLTPDSSETDEDEYPKKQPDFRRENEDDEDDDQKESDRNSSEPKKTYQRKKGEQIESNEPEVSIPENPDITDFPAISLSPDTHKWTVASAFYNLDGWNKSMRVYKLLEGTSNEISKSQTYASVSQCFDAGIIMRRPAGGRGNGYEYTLTQFGRDYLEAVNNDTAGWNLRPY